MPSAQVLPDEGAVESVKRVMRVAPVEDHAESGAALRFWGRIVWVPSHELTFRGYSNPRT